MRELRFLKGFLFLSFISVVLISSASYAQCVPLTAATITTPLTFVCKNGSAVLTANIQNPGSFYEWYSGDAMVHSGVGSYTLDLSIAAPGPYKVRYYVSASPACYSSFSNEITFEIQDTPLLEVSPVQSKICSGETTQLILSSSNVPTATFTWSGSGVTGASDGSGNVISQTLTNSNTEQPWEG